jgi:multimeric flavodoxin WrbA
MRLPPPIRPHNAAMKRLLAVFSSQTGRTRALLEAACAGVEESGDAELRVCGALQAGLDDLLWADGLLLATPENFGYMSGALKDFLDRVYYPSEGLKTGLPYVVLVSAGNDGSGAVRAIERIAGGCGWNRVAQPLIVHGDPDGAALGQARELGQLLAAGLSAGIF